MNQQKTFAPAAILSASALRVSRETYAAFLLGRAIPILEGLVESPTDAIDIQMARELLADYRKWMARES